MKKNKGLSPKELRVLCWAYYGKTNPEIGQLMGLSPLTIKNHFQKILVKLNVETRLRAVTLALERGIINMSPTVLECAPKTPMPYYEQVVKQ